MKNEVILDRTPEQIEAIEKETREFTCPCCQAKLQFRCRINIASVGTALSADETAKRDGLESRTIGADEQRKIDRKREFADVLATAKAAGIYQAFEKALEAAKSHVPNDKEAYFLKWLQHSTKQNVPAFALRQCLQNGDASGNLSLYGFGNVSVIVRNGQFKVFIPRKLVNGNTIETLEVTSAGVRPKEVMNLKIWVRTKYGYVERSSEFANELRKHSIGSFAV